MPISIEGLSPNDVLALPSRPTLSVDLAHTGGREGVRPSLVSPIRRYAVLRNLEQIEWLE